MRVEHATRQAYVLRWTACQRVPHENERFKLRSLALALEQARNDHPHVNSRHCLGDRLAREALEQPLREIRLPAGARTLPTALAGL